MGKKLEVAFIFPGQGEQFPSMGKDFFDHFSIAKETFEEAEEILSMKISDVVFYGTMENLTKTIHCQPAIFITSIAIMRVILQQFPELKPDICAGLSLGEYSALCAANALSFKDALRLLHHRAKYIHEACEKTDGAMAAVLGLEEEKVNESITQLQAKGESIWVANYNCPGQIVISGTKKALEKAMTSLKEKGAKRVIPLAVAGAFHSGLMKEAEDKLKTVVNEVKIQPSSVPVVMNYSGEIVTDEKEMKDQLVKQVSGSVRWEKGIRTMSEKGCKLFIEIGPGRVLTNLNKKIGTDATCISIGKISDLDILAEHLNALKTLV